MLHNFINEMLTIIRGLWKRPSFTIIVILTLAAGMGACLGVFSIVDSVLLRPLPFRSPEQILLVPSLNQDATGKIEEYGSSLSDFLDWRERNRSFQALIAMQPTEVAVTGGGEDPEQLEAGIITANLFETLGVRFVLGRSFSVQEESANSNVLIFSHGLWQRRFGGASDVIGKTVVVDGVAREIIGVAPPEFFFVSAAELWLPFDLTIPRNPRTPNRAIAVAGRLREGIGAAQASEEMRIIAQQMATEFPATNAGWSAKALPVREPYVREVRGLLFFLLASVSFLLLIVCVNVANLVLIRHMERQSEIAVRLALGAGRIHVLRRSFYENIFLSIVGGFLGLLFSMLALKPLVALSPLVASSPSGNRILNSVTFDSRMALFTLILSITIGGILTALPLLRFSSTDLFNQLKSAGRRASGSFRDRKIQKVFVVAQLAISFLLLVGAALMMQSFHRMKAIDPGFKTESLISARLILPGSRYETHEKRSLFQQQIVETIRSIPGVQAVSTSTRLPLNEFAMTTLFEVDGVPPPEGGFVANFRRIGASYFNTLQTPVLEGREFGREDTEKGMPVAVVSLQMAKRFWPGQSAVGKRVRRLSRTDAEWRTVVGVVADLKDSSLTAEPGITLYTPYNQGSIPGFHLVIRASGNPNLILAPVRERIRQHDAALPLYQIATAEEWMMDSLSRPRFAAVLLALFALLGVFVAVIGIYGVVSYSTARRFNEIGLRIAIGARKRAILQMILEQSLRLSIWGILFGGIASMIVERSITSMWSTPGGFSLYIATSALIAITALMASFIPALRATRIDPIVAIRYE